MRHETAVVQILLIVSVANFALAAPAVVQQRHLNCDFLAPESLDDSPPKSPPGLSHHDWVSKPRMDSSSSSSSPVASYHYNPDTYYTFAQAYRPVRWWEQDLISNHDSVPQSLSGSTPHSGSVGSIPESVSDPAESMNSPVAAAPSTHDGSSQVAAVPSAHGDPAPAPEPGDPPSHHDPAPESSAMTPEANQFLNYGLKQKIKVLGAVTALSGVVGAVYGINKNQDKVSYRAETAGGDLASRSVAGRAAGTHLRPHKRASVSWSR